MTIFMIDIHSHILPHLDDGAKDWNESLEMCEIALQDGIHTIVATPHMKPGVYLPTKELIFSKVKELNQRIRHEARGTRQESKRPNSHPSPHTSRLTHHVPRTSPLVLTILPGADTYFQPDILRQIEEGNALFLGEHGNPMNPMNSTNTMNFFRYLLLELPDYFLFPQVKELIKELRSKHIVPILSHPERNSMIQRNKNILKELIQAGALSQVTAMSLTGEFGKDIKKFSKTLLSHNLVHLIASDSHSKDRRPPILSPAVAEAAKVIGRDKAEMMVKDTPQAIIEGKEVTISHES